MTRAVLAIVTSALPAMTTKVTKGAKGTFSGRLSGTGGPSVSGSWSCQAGCELKQRRTR